MNTSGCDRQFFLHSTSPVLIEKAACVIRLTTQESRIHKIYERKVQPLFLTGLRRAVLLTCGPFDAFITAVFKFKNYLGTIKKVLAISVERFSSQIFMKLQLQEILS